MNRRFSMNRFRRSTYALITATILGLSSPIATADVGHKGRPDDPDPSDEYTYKWAGGHTVTGTLTYGGITITFSTTINSCGPSGSDCKLTPLGYQPK